MFIFPVSVGAIMLLLAGASIARQCGGTNGVSASTIRAGLVLLCMFAISPVGLACSAQFAKLRIVGYIAGWVWMVSVMGIMPLALLVHYQIRSKLNLAEVGESVLKNSRGGTEYESRMVRINNSLDFQIRRLQTEMPTEEVHDDQGEGALTGQTAY